MSSTATHWLERLQQFQERHPRRVMAGVGLALSLLGGGALAVASIGVRVSLTNCTGCSSMQSTAWSQGRPGGGQPVGVRSALLGRRPPGGQVLLDVGTITTTGAVSFGEAVELVSGTTITTTNANVRFESTVDSHGPARALTIDAGSGSVTLVDAAGSARALLSLQIDAASLSFASIKVDGDAPTWLMASTMSRNSTPGLNRNMGFFASLTAMLAFWTGVVVP